MLTLHLENNLLNNQSTQDDTCMERNECVKSIRKLNHFKLHITLHYKNEQQTQMDNDYLLEMVCG